MLALERNVDILEVLHQIAATVAATTRLDDALGPVLRALCDDVGLKRVALSLVDTEREEVVIEAAHGLTPSEVRRGRYAFGEGIIGRVVVAGEAEVVQRISQDPRFVDKTGARGDGTERAYVCVPVKVSGEVLATLSGYRPVSAPDGLDADRHVLSVVGAMLAPMIQHSADRRGDQRDANLSAHRSELQPANIIGRSKAMLRVYDLIGQVADSPTTALLRGESGTGKELVAHALHHHSSRRRGPFVKVNCAALPESIIESELFGHERGAFTGALQRRRGRFELAEGGTIFLDEIGDLSPAVQIKLLRVLQEREFERVGGSDTLHVEVRVVAATSRDLEAMIATGEFRTDLYYRLNVFPIHLPPLRDRRADVLLIADHFVELFNKAHGKHVQRISTPAIDMLMAYHWPGNVRELENCLERAVLLARDEVILGHHLPPTLQTAEATDTKPSQGLREALATVERDLVVDALKSARGNMAEAARDLGITERVMGLRVDKYGIDPSRFKPRRQIPTFL